MCLLKTYLNQQQRKGMPAEYLVSEFGDRLQEMSFKVVDVGLDVKDCQTQFCGGTTTGVVSKNYYYLGLNIVRVNFPCSDEELARIAFKVKEYYFNVFFSAQTLEGCAHDLINKVVQFVPCTENGHKLCLKEAETDFQSDEKQTIRLIRILKTMPEDQLFSLVSFR